jgi:hypothetical protein
MTAAKSPKRAAAVQSAIVVWRGAERAAARLQLPLMALESLRAAARR